MPIRSLAVAVCLAAVLASRGLGQATPEKIRVVLIDGQNNHDWRKTTPIMKATLEQSGRFLVDVATAPQKLSKPAAPKKESPEAAAKQKADLEAYQAAVKQQAAAPFHPDLDKYQVVLSNYNGEPWPKAFQQDLEARLKVGKIGLVIVHAANNSFPTWTEYTRMMGMGWRGANVGDRLYLDDDGKQVRVPKGQGDGAGHRFSGQYQVIVRNEAHPITKGMPKVWMHAPEELYENMRGPIEDVTLLATAYSPATKVHEPMIWTVAYGTGRVFHTPMGHSPYSMRCVGFATTLQRGTEWAATGQVTLPIPENFPTPDKVSLAPEVKK